MTMNFCFADGQKKWMHSSETEGYLYWMWRGASGSDSTDALRHRVRVAAWSKAWVCDRTLNGIAVSNPVGARMFVCCECWVLSGRGLCDGLIPCPEEFYECLSVASVVCCQVEVSATGRSLVHRSLTERGVSVYDPQIWSMRRPRPINLSISWGEGGWKYESRDQRVQ